MPAKTVPAPERSELEACLGAALPVWDAFHPALVEAFGPCEEMWVPSKSPFGKAATICLKKRVLLYLIPEAPGFRVSIVLGEKAAEAALDSDLAVPFKKAVRGATKYPEGRGVHLAACQIGDLPGIVRLVGFKLGAGISLRTRS
jgi:hypothetical protein